MVNIVDELTDNVLAIGGSIVAFYMMLTGMQVPEWYIALLGTAWALYFKQKSDSVTYV